MRHTHLLTILYADQQSINKVPKIWGQLNEKGNGSSPDPFLARLWRALRKKGSRLNYGFYINSLANPRGQPPTHFETHASLQQQLLSYSPDVASQLERAH